MEDAHFTETEKSKTSEFKCENYAHCFLDVWGIVHWEFVPPGQTVSQEFYLEVLRRLRENVRRKRPELWRSGDWFLHHDNVPSSHSFVCDPVFGLSGMDRRSPPTLFTGPSPLWFLFIPDNVKNIERKEICHRGGGENSFAGAIQQHQASAVPEMLHTVGKKIGQVYCLQWRVFCRGLSVFCSKYN